MRPIFGVGATQPFYRIAILADDVGLGKTMQLLAAAAFRHHLVLLREEFEPHINTYEALISTGMRSLLKLDVVVTDEVVIKTLKDLLQSLAASEWYPRPPPRVVHALVEATRHVIEEVRSQWPTTTRLTDDGWLHDVMAASSPLEAELKEKAVLIASVPHVLSK